MTTSKSCDFLNRLTAISSTPVKSPVVAFSYGYNSANQRVALTNADANYWDYRYDYLGQVTNGWQYNSQGQVIGTRKYGYRFDDIGNRDWTVTNTVTVDYTANLLNQYTAIGGASPQHDADGNLSQDARWDYTWDAENRLVAMQARAGITPAWRLEFTYDSQGRRIHKVLKEYAWGAWQVVGDTRFVYDGWNLRGMLDGWDPGMSTYFTWGLDLSGTTQGAGGVGGLLMLRAEYLGTHYCCYDGNGNVTGTVDATDGSLTALYEYGPFGELLHAEGGLALMNPFRFSTKYQDDETGLLYYGHRYYALGTGRWNSRDPIGLRGGKNLYGTVGNDPVSRVDYLGLFGGPAMDCLKPDPNYTCCRDRCSPGEVRRDNFEVKLTTPDVTPAQDEAADAAIKALDRVSDCSDWITPNPAEIAVSKMLDFADVSALYQQAKFAFLEHRAWLWTRLEYSKCHKRLCRFLIGKRFYDWDKYPKTPWVKCDIGIDSLTGWYLGKVDALANLPACLEAHTKQEFSQ